MSHIRLPPASTDPSGLSIATFVKTKCSIAEVATFVESFENSALPECWSASETNKWQTKDYFSYYHLLLYNLLWIMKL